jgi:hypothetical protein
MAAGVAAMLGKPLDPPGACLVVGGRGDRLYDEESSRWTVAIDMGSSQMFCRGLAKLWETIGTICRGCEEVRQRFEGLQRCDTISLRNP